MKLSVFLYKILVSSFLKKGPSIYFTDSEIKDFEQLYQNCILKGLIDIDYNLPYPKYKFIDYLIEKKKLLAHGSNYKELNILMPFRASREVGGGFGDKQAVFVASDSIWALYFATVDRSKSGLIKNGVIKFKKNSGEIERYYKFKVNPKFRGDKMLTNGMIYMVPTKDFVKDKIYDQWASHSPVIPVAKLKIDAEDFGSLQLM